MKNSPLLRQTVDLHIHSNASDGTFSPLEILELARNAGLKAISITDHDTIEGSRCACEASFPQIEVLSGVEISTSFTPGTLHILGYLISLDHPVLDNTLKVLQNARKDRNPKIIQRLRELGIDITYEEVLRVADGGQVGRPHIAHVLVKKGVVSDINEAFDRYLNTRGPAYVEKFRLSPTKAIQLILEAGGIPVLAHPFTLEIEEEKTLDRVVYDLVQEGLKGIEVYYSDHKSKHTLQYLRLAKRYDLLITGGTDFHGERKPGVRIGVGRGNLNIPYRLVRELKKEHMLMNNKRFSKNIC
nr:phosphatase [Desulfobacterales bacterium]